MGQHFPEYLHAGHIWFEPADWLELPARSAQAPGPTLLDALPNWSVYILYVEAIGLVMFLLLYLNFAVKDRRFVKKKVVACS